MNISYPSLSSHARRVLALGPNCMGEFSVLETNGCLPSTLITEEWPRLADCSIPPVGWPITSAITVTRTVWRLDTYGVHPRLPDAGLRLPIYVHQDVH